MTEVEIDFRPEGDTLGIVLCGEIDLSNSESVRNEIFAAISNDLTLVHLDLAELHRIDSAGMRLLFALAERLQLLRVAYLVTAPPGSRPRHMLERTGFDTLVQIRD